MKYGIKHKNGNIQALTSFTNEVLEGFIEITKEKYDQFTEILSLNLFVTYDATKNEMVVDQLQEAQLIDEIEKSEKKERLKALSIEIDLLEKMGEPTADAQKEFNNLLTEYHRENQVS